jgi:Flp pilus assembly protein CpaB
MYTARIVVLAIALSAGGVAAYPASGSDTKAPPAEPVAQLQTVDVLVAKSDIGLGQTVSPGDTRWQTWPAATTSNTFIRRNERPDAVTQIASSLERKPEQAETLARARQSGSLSLALRSIADVSLVESTTDEQAPKQGGSINVVRYGVQSSITTQK